MVEIPEPGLLAKIKMKKYDHWKSRGGSLVIVTTEGEVCAKLRRGKRQCNG